MSQIALVTGANRGLGLGVVRQLLEDGYEVILTSRNKTKGEQATEELKDQFDHVHFHQLDVSKSESIKDCAEWVDQKFGNLDILINNAGINYDTWQNAMNADLEESQKTMDVNFFGPWRVTQAFWPLLKKNNWGRVVNVSSGSGSLTREESGTPAYSTSKAALNMLTIKQSHSATGTGVKINSVCPGWVRTDMGGSDATRSIPEGAKSIIWAAKIPDDGPTGGFFRDGERIDW
ncbi:SDR family oxidoreductase [Portibacter marinus]|uniref:SDR family oxidoreductase n=1 Tax=Portibacter marinus TaxID=2898660 RepID=UPI001F41BBB2|nr:SDR family oxidoreductase [Portibacter marinus]